MARSPSVEAEFRPAVETDFDAILSFMRLYYAQDRVPYDAAVARRALARIVRDRSLGRVWVIEGKSAERTTEAIGYMVLTLGYSLEYGGRDAFLDELFVREDRRRRGIGVRALEVFAAACRDLDVKAIHLEVDEANAPARALYRKFGFIDHDRILMTREVTR